jgi:hypothetical protein
VTDLRVVAYPADDYGCGHHRLIWPCEVLARAGHQVEVVRAQDRQVRIHVDGETVTRVEVDPGIDVLVFQRTTDRRLVAAIGWLREHGHTVVIDVDDDLSAIDPRNPAWTFLDPHRATREVGELARRVRLTPSQRAAHLTRLEQRYTHSWHHLADACRAASLVTVSTPALLPRYAKHGRGHVFPNYIAEHYLAETTYHDSRTMVWPAALHSHPGDPAAVGSAVRRLVDEGVGFAVAGAHNEGAAAAFGLRAEPTFLDDVGINEWHQALATVGVAIVPLVDTRFNAGKSWLKGLELAAVGTPFVASPRAEYRRLHALGVGRLAEKPRDWYRQLRDLVDSADLRAEEAARNRELVRRHLRLEDHAEELWAAWERAWRLDHPARQLAAV